MTDIIVAIDQSTWSSKDSDTLMELAELELIQGAKLGLEMFTSDAYDRALGEIMNLDIKYMADYKLHDIGNTVGKATRNIAFQMPDILTVHAMGSSGMIRAAVDAIGHDGKVAAVTILTDITDEDLSFILDMEARRDKLVPALADWATQNGARAIVASGKELPRLMEHRSEHVREAYKIIPGTRLGGDHRDQRNVVKPKEAVEMGADALVIGSEIWGADDPVEVAKKINEHLEES